MAVEQRAVERALVVEVPVQDGLGDARCGRDVLEPRAVEAVRAEELPGGLDDQVPALRRSQAPARFRPTHKLPDSSLCGTVSA
jgi:hypothetical protein